MLLNDKVVLLVVIDLAAPEIDTGPVKVSVAVPVAVKSPPISIPPELRNTNESDVE